MTRHGFEWKQGSVYLVQVMLGHDQQVTDDDRRAAAEQAELRGDDSDSDDAQRLMMEASVSGRVALGRRAGRRPAWRSSRASPP